MGNRLETSGGDHGVMETRLILVGCGCTNVAGISTPVVFGVQPIGYVGVSSCRVLNLPPRYVFGAPLLESMPVRAGAS
jgi:hypothetical protein